MLRRSMVLLLLTAALPAGAQMIDAGELDAAARGAQGQSVLFRGQADDEMYWQDQEELRRLAYEEEMRRREEEARRAEEERRKALRPVNLFGRSLKIYAEVNGEVITTRDMQDRVNVFVATTQIPVNAETKQMVMEKVLQSAIDEKIKLQEAEKNGIDISAADLEKGMAGFARSNGLTVAQLRQMLKEAEVDENVFKAQMKAEMAWTRLVQRRAAQEAQISQSEIDNAIKTITEDGRTEKYLVSEIVIPKRKAGNIEDLVENLRQDPRFELYAMQFSDSPSARNGGKLGWINKGQLAQPLEKNLAIMKEGAVSNPISVGADYYILRLEKRYRPGVDKAPEPDQEEIRTMLEGRKTEEIAGKYLRDLRNKAIVEKRA